MSKTIGKIHEKPFDYGRMATPRMTNLRRLIFGADMTEENRIRIKPRVLFGEVTSEYMWHPGISMPLHWKTHSIFFNDFKRWDADDWVITTVELGAGSATEAIQDAQHGVVRFTNAAGDNDLDSIQSVAEIAKLVDGKDLFFEVRFRISEPTQSDVILGLCIRDTTPLASTDYVYFVKDDGDTNWDLVAAKNSSETEVAAVDTADTEWHTFGFYANGVDEITPWIDGTAGEAIDTSGSICDDEELAITWHNQNGDANARWLEIDYYVLAQER